MKKSLLFILIMLLSKISFCQSEKPVFDQVLADSLGADAYGMKNYVLVIIKTGTNTTENKEATDSLFAGHQESIGRLAKEGKIIVSGPMKKNEKTYRGIFILNVATIEAAIALLKTDPAINAKLLDVELYQWYGSAALPVYLPYHDKVQKSKF